MIGKSLNISMTGENLLQFSFQYNNDRKYQNIERRGLYNGISISENILIFL